MEKTCFLQGIDIPRKDTLAQRRRTLFSLIVSADRSGSIADEIALEYFTVRLVILIRNIVNDILAADKMEIRLFLFSYSLNDE